jgi:hypothetical protein
VILVGTSAVDELLRNCSRAFPGRFHFLLSPAKEKTLCHRRMGPGVRGIGAHRTWLPWISANHLRGITGPEELDPTLYQRLAKGD